jgi:hypothetical protein
MGQSLSDLSQLNIECAESVVELFFLFGKRRGLFRMGGVKLPPVCFDGLGAFLEIVGMSRNLGLSMFGLLGRLLKLLRLL